MATLVPQLSEQNGSGASPIPSSVSKPHRGGKRSITSRYKDAYLTGRALTGLGALVKFVAVIVYVCVLLGGALAGARFSGSMVVGVIAGAVAGFIACIPIYTMGILVAAQGQILKATLDTAVNTSPLLNEDEMRQIMSLD